MSLLVTAQQPIHVQNIHAISILPEIFDSRHQSQVRIDLIRNGATDYHKKHVGSVTRFSGCATTVGIASIAGSREHGITPSACLDIDR